MMVRLNLRESNTFDLYYMKYSSFFAFSAVAPSRGGGGAQAQVSLSFSTQKNNAH